MLIFLSYMKIFSKKLTDNLPKNLPGKNIKCLVYLKEVASYINYIQAI